MKIFLKISLIFLIFFLGYVFLFNNKVFAYHQCSNHPSSCSICPSSGIPPGRACYTETRCCDHACINGVVTCTVNSYCGQGYVNFSCGCTPSCTGYMCGQPNGCGGNCGTSDVGNWQYYWPDGGCDGAPAPGTCGTYQITQTWWRADNCGNSQQFEQAASCGQGCAECGPSYGAWSACSPTTFTRSRTVSYNCQGPQTQTEACVGQVTGTLFDASNVNDCSNVAAQPKISGVTVRATSQVNSPSVNYQGTTNVNGVYTISGARVPETYGLTFENLGASYALKLSCDGNQTVSLATQSQSVTRRFGFALIADPWFQAKGGDIYAQTGISTDIPASCASSANCNNYVIGPTTYTPLVVDSDAGSSPLTRVASGTIYMGYPTYNNARISRTGIWSSSADSGRDYDYGFFYANTSDETRTNWSGTGEPNPGNTSGIFLSSGTLTLNGSWNVEPTELVVLLHDGDVNITGNIDVSVQGYLAVIASGDITFASNVTQAEGVYIGDTITVASTGNTATEQRFVGEGSFIGWNGVNLNRDRGSLNGSQSAEFFSFRPDFTYYAPDSLKTSKVIWQEVAP